MSKKSYSAAHATSTTHGLTTLKRAVKSLGSRAIDKRTAVGKTLSRWRAELIRDLGGEETISTQERALVNEAVMLKLKLDSINAWVLTQPSLINARKRALLPVVRESVQLSDALARYLAALGLKRRVKPAPDLSDYMAARSHGDPVLEPQADETPGAQAGQKGDAACMSDGNHSAL